MESSVTCVFVMICVASVFCVWFSWSLENCELRLAITLL